MDQEEVLLRPIVNDDDDGTGDSDADVGGGEEVAPLPEEELDEDLDNQDDY